MIGSEWSSGVARRNFGMGAGVVAGAALGLVLAAPAGAQSIGSAVAVVPAAQGLLGGSTRTLTVGTDVSQNERVRTTAAGSARLKFRDDTVLTVGPNSEVVLDSFVYNPDSSASRAVVTATRGAFRFVTGKSDKGAYEIRTPTVTIGVRGTIVNFVIEAGGVRVQSVIGTALICRGGPPSANISRCSSLTPEGGVVRATPQGVVRTGGNLNPQLDAVHAQLNTASGQPLVEPSVAPGTIPAAAGGGGAGGAGDVGGGGLTLATETVPPTPTPVDRSTAPPGELPDFIEPPTPPEPIPPPLVPGPVLGPPPASGTALSPNEEELGWALRFQFDIETKPGQSLITGVPLIRAEGFVGDTVVKIGSLTNRTAIAAELASNAIFTLARWTNGIIDVTDPAALHPGPVAVGPNQGVHFYVARRTLPAELPPATGVTTDLHYTLHAATRPTFSSGLVAPGVFAGEARLRIDATRAYYAFQGTVTFAAGGSTPTIAYRLETHGGLANPALSNVSFALAGAGTTLVNDRAVTVTPLSGTICSSGCSATMSGGALGAAFQHVATTYRILDPGLGLGSVVGVAVFTRESNTPASAPGDGDTVVPPVHLIVTGIGTASRQVAGANGVWLDPAGAAYRVGSNPGFHIKRETARHRESGFAGGPGGPAGAVIGWSRWTEGYVSGGVNAFLRPNDGVHIVAGLPATGLPGGGTVTYNHIGSTKPTIRDGSVAPGTFSGQMAVQFGATAKVGVDFNVGIGGHTYNVRSAGGATAPGTSQINLSPSGVFAVSALPVAPGGPACAGAATCSANVNGFLAGPGGMFAGVGYAIGSSGGTGAKVVSGVAAFRAAGGGAAAVARR